MLNQGKRSRRSAESQENKAAGRVREREVEGEKKRKENTEVAMGGNKEQEKQEDGRRTASSFADGIRFPLNWSEIANRT